MCVCIKIDHLFMLVRYSFIIVLIIYIDCFLVAIHRYYESRRRIYNDTKPHRQAKVSENKQKAKRKGYQTRVMIDCTAYILMLIEFEFVLCAVQLIVVEISNM